METRKLSQLKRAFLIGGLGGFLVVRDAFSVEIRTVIAPTISRHELQTMRVGAEDFSQLQHSNRLF